MLEFKNVTKTYGDITALQDVSFKIAKGEFVFLTGPSGAGKTTIIKLILHQITPDSGEIIFDGEEITKMKPSKVSNLRRKIGTVFQDYKVLTERTVEENIEVALAAIGIPEKYWKQKVASALELVNLESKAKYFPMQLSGGELQRVSLARALVVNPILVLADEPTGNLDWDIAFSIMRVFEKIHKEGKTIIMATHNREIVDKMKKRVIELKNGKHSH